MSTTRRSFIKKSAGGAVGITFGGAVSGMSAKSYSRIIGANDRLNIAIMGLGRRLGAFVPPVTSKESNVHLSYLCDVMQRQMDRALNQFSKGLDYKPRLEKDIRKIIDDRNVDVVINATPDHWHAPGTIMAVKAGKHVFVEKPCSHNPWENEMLIACQKKYGKVVQMGNQQRSAPESIEIINEIHNGIIGDAYEAMAFYSNGRGKVPLPQKAPVPAGLDWELFQGPAPRQEYKHDTWDYNWHWYGWTWGTGETGNNANHEFDIARWALKVAYPERVDVDAEKRHFPDDGWTMYDTMLATLVFPGNKIIRWDGRSRNNYSTYGAGRGTIIYGTEGSVFIDRGGYKLFDRAGKLIRERKSGADEGGTALGGGGDMSTMHVINFFDAIRGKVKPTAPIDDAAFSTLYCHYANISSRVNKGFDVDTQTGRIYDRDAMKLWDREYEPGWKPVI
jgi:predicted dehydrogenase